MSMFYKLKKNSRNLFLNVCVCSILKASKFLNKHDANKEKYELYVM